MYKTNFHQEDISNTSFLVTGGAGFIGSNIVNYLLTFGAKKVRVIDNLSNSSGENLDPFLKLPNFEFIKGDISNYEDCLRVTEGIDYISNQAALGSVPRSLANPIATNNANVVGFLNMITAARENKVKRIVYASSSSVYGDSQKLPKIEEEIGSPLSPYAVSKYTNELYAKVSHLSYGQEIIGLRYFNIFGPNQSPDGAYAAVIPLFIEALLKNQSPFINGDGKQSRDFTYIENAVQANIRALFTKNEKALGEVFNVAVGEKFSLVDLFELIKSGTGATISAVHREERAGDVKNSLADISKAKNLLGFQPQVRFKEGIERTIQWFKQKHNL
jgi:UDP-N-acetylglucosamine 4-epimerase